MALFTNDSDVSLEIESYVSENGGSYLDATMVMCEHHRIEPEAIAKYVSKPIREKLEIEARDLNILPKKKSKLPFSS